MTRIQKGLYFKIISICVSTCVFLHTIAYAAPNLRTNLIFDPINKSKEEKRVHHGKEVVSSLKFSSKDSRLEKAPYIFTAPSPTKEYSIYDFIKSIKFSDFIETLRSDTGGQLFGRLVALSLLPLATFVTFVFLAPFVKIRSPGPIFFGQERIGYNGKSIIVLKLRTFSNESDATLRHKTPFGRVIRHTGLDEIPQILSIVLGDMQWFGPRPYQKKEIPSRYLNKYINTVLSKTKPGVFCRSALRDGIGAGLLVTAEQMDLDYEELSQRSVVNNIHLLFSIALLIGRSCLAVATNKFESPIDKPPLKFDPSIFLNPEWNKKDSVAHIIQSRSVENKGAGEFFVNLITATLEELNKIAGAGRGYQLLDSALLLNNFQSILDKQKLGIILYQRANDSGIEKIFCFNQETGVVVASSTEEYTSVSEDLVPVALYPHYFMLDENIAIQTLPGILDRNSLKKSIELWIDKKTPELTSTKNITIMPYAPVGCRIGKYVKVMVDGIVHYVVGLNEKRQPVEVYPMDWENKPNVIPAGAFLVAQSLGLHNMHGKRVADLGTGDFAIYALRSAWRKARLVVGVELDPERAENAKKMVKRTGQKIEILKGDWYKPIQDIEFDTIISAPPYTPGKKGQGQKSIAENGGPDGREHINHIIKESFGHLREEGQLIMHHPAYLGVEKPLGLSSCTFEMMRELGLKPTVLARYWFRASKYFVENFPYIKEIYPNIEIIKIGKDWYYESVVVEGKKISKSPALLKPVIDPP